MSSHRVPETQRASVARFVPARVSDFFAEAGTLTHHGDVPLLPEWIEWAGQYEKLDEVWRASRSPEFLLFMVGHAVRQSYVEERATVLEAVERFVDWCVAYAQLDPDPFRASAEEDGSQGWFAVAGDSPFGRARRAAQAAERMVLGDASPHELLDERTEQAAVLRLFLGNPFYDARRVEVETAGEDGDVPDCDPPQLEDPGSDEQGREDRDASARSELLLAPAQRGAWGVVTRLSGPPDPPGASGSAEATLRNADGHLRRGMILLSKKPVEDAVAIAEECFREALSMLISTVGEMHPKVAYACDRIGLTCQIQGYEEEAEAMYLRAIALRDAASWDHTLWDEVTLLNLAILYSDQGRYGLRDAMLERLEEARDGDTESGGDEEFRDPDQLELS